MTVCADEKGFFHNVSGESLTSENGAETKHKSAKLRKGMHSSLIPRVPTVNLGND